MAQVRVLNRVEPGHAGNSRTWCGRPAITTRKRSPELLMTISGQQPARTRVPGRPVRPTVPEQLRGAAAPAEGRDRPRMPGISDVTDLRPARLRDAGVGQPGEAGRPRLTRGRRGGRPAGGQNVAGRRRAQSGRRPGTTRPAFQFTIGGVGRLVTTEEEFARWWSRSGPTGSRSEGPRRGPGRTRVPELGREFNRFDRKPRPPASGCSCCRTPTRSKLGRRSTAKMEDLEPGLPAEASTGTRSGTTPPRSSWTRSRRCSSRSATRSSWSRIVVLVFLQSWRAAVIPLAAVPVAIIGTFAAMAAARVQRQQPDAVRAGPGRRDRGGRRHRRGRSRAAQPRRTAWPRARRR